MKELVILKQIKNLTFILLCFFFANCQSEKKYIGNYMSIQIMEFKSPISSNFVEKRKDECSIQLDKNNQFKYICTISGTGMGTTEVIGTWQLKKSHIILNPKIDSVITIDKMPGYYTNFLISKDSLTIISNKQIKHKDQIFEKVEF